MKHPVKLSLILVAAALSLLTAIATAGAPEIVPYQGFLRDDDGTPLTGTVDLEIGFFASESGGSALSNEFHAGVPIDDGVFTIMLGAVSGLPAALWDESALYIETTVDGETLAPRRRVGSSPFALRAAVADVALTGGEADDDWTISGGDIYRDGGNVGIGAADPEARLHVTDQSGAGPFAIIQGGGAVFENVGLRLQDLGTANGNRNVLEFMHTASVGSTLLPIAAATITSRNFGTDSAFGIDLTMETATNNQGGVNEDQLVLQRTGRVGVGTATPESQLDVAGDARAESFQATATLGAASDPAAGGVYADNVVYAWARINGAGTIEQSFGIDSVTRLGTGHYEVHFKQNLPGAVVPVVTAFSANDIVVSRVASTSADRCEVRMNLWIPGTGFINSDYRFLVQVTGRP